MTDTTQPAALPALSDEQIASIYARWRNDPGASHADLIRDAARAALAATEPAVPEGLHAAAKLALGLLEQLQLELLLERRDASLLLVKCTRDLRRLLAAAPTPPKVAEQAVQSPAEGDGHAAFEAWAKSHGGLDVVRVNSGERGAHELWPCTYYQRETEIAWRAWANKPQPKHTAPEHLPTKEHIRELAQEALDQIMEQAQVFASAWSLVGGPFDSGNAMSDAEDTKAELRTMVRSLADLAAETVRPAAQAPAPAPEPVGEVVTRHYGGRTRSIGFQEAQLYKGVVLEAGTKLYAAQAPAVGDRDV